MKSLKDMEVFVLVSILNLVIKLRFDLIKRIAIHFKEGILAKMSNFAKISHTVLEICLFIAEFLL